MSLDDFEELMGRFTKLDTETMTAEDDLKITLAVMKFLKSVQPIVDKYVPKEQPEHNDEFNFNEFWRLIDGEQE